jgi:hypothetical protein
MGIFGLTQKTKGKKWEEGIRTKNNQEETAGEE